MTTMEEDLRALLLANSGLAALVGTRITWNDRPQGSALPAVVLTLVSEVTDYTYANVVDMTTSRVQADIWATSAYTSWQVSRAFVPAVSGYRGVYGGTVFRGIFLESRFDGAEPPAAGAQPIHRISRDLMIKHEEA